MFGDIELQTRRAGLSASAELLVEYICERTTKFHEKILFYSGVINIQIPMTKYFGFQYSVAYCSHLSLVNS